MFHALQSFTASIKRTRSESVYQQEENRLKKRKKTKKNHLLPNSSKFLQSMQNVQNDSDCIPSTISQLTSLSKSVELRHSSQLGEKINENLRIFTGSITDDNSSQLNLVGNSYRSSYNGEGETEPNFHTSNNGNRRIMDEKSELTGEVESNCSNMNNRINSNLLHRSSTTTTTTPSSIQKQMTLITNGNNKGENTLDEDDGIKEENYKDDFLREDNRLEVKTKENKETNENIGKEELIAKWCLEQQKFSQLSLNQNEVSSNSVDNDLVNDQHPCQTQIFQHDDLSHNSPNNINDTNDRSIEKKGENKKKPHLADSGSQDGSLLHSVTKNSIPNHQQHIDRSWNNCERFSKGENDPLRNQLNLSDFREEEEGKDDDENKNNISSAEVHLCCLNTEEDFESISIEENEKKSLDVIATDIHVDDDDDDNNNNSLYHNLYCFEQSLPLSLSHSTITVNDIDLSHSIDCGSFPNKTNNNSLLNNQTLPSTDIRHNKCAVGNSINSTFHTSSSNTSFPCNSSDVPSSTSISTKSTMGEPSVSSSSKIYEKLTIDEQMKENVDEQSNIEEDWMAREPPSNDISSDSMEYSSLADHHQIISRGEDIEKVLCISSASTGSSSSTTSLYEERRDRPYAINNSKLRVKERIELYMASTETNLMNSSGEHTNAGTIGKSDEIITKDNEILLPKHPFNDTQPTYENCETFFRPSSPKIYESDRPIQKSSTTSSSTTPIILTTTVTSHHQMNVMEYTSPEMTMTNLNVNDDLMIKNYHNMSKIINCHLNNNTAKNTCEKKNKNKINDFLTDDDHIDKDQSSLMTTSLIEVNAKNAFRRNLPAFGIGKNIRQNPFVLNDHKLQSRLLDNIEFDEMITNKKNNIYPEEKSASNLDVFFESTKLKVEEELGQKQSIDKVSDDGKKHQSFITIHSSNPLITPSTNQIICSTVETLTTTIATSITSTNTRNDYHSTNASNSEYVTIVAGRTSKSEGKVKEHIQMGNTSTANCITKQMEKNQLSQSTNELLENMRLISEDIIFRNENTDSEMFEEKQPEHYEQLDNDHNNDQHDDQIPIGMMHKNEMNVPQSDDCHISVISNEQQNMMHKEKIQQELLHQIDLLRTSLANLNVMEPKTNNSHDDHENDDGEDEERKKINQNNCMQKKNGPDLLSLIGIEHQCNDMFIEEMRTEKKCSKSIIHTSNQQTTKDENIIPNFANSPPDHLKSMSNNNNNNNNENKINQKSNPLVNITDNDYKRLLDLFAYPLANDENNINEILQRIESFNLNELLHLTNKKKSKEPSSSSSSSSLYRQIDMKNIRTNNGDSTVDSLLSSVEREKFHPAKSTSKTSSNYSTSTSNDCLIHDHVDAASNSSSSGTSSAICISSSPDNVVEKHRSKFLNTCLHNIQEQDSDAGFTDSPTKHDKCFTKTKQHTALANSSGEEISSMSCDLGYAASHTSLSQQNSTIESSVSDKSSQKKSSSPQFVKERMNSHLCHSHNDELFDSSDNQSMNNFTQLKQTMNDLVKANVEKEQEIDELRKQLSRFKRIQDLLLTIEATKQAINQNGSGNNISNIQTIGSHNMNNSFHPQIIESQIEQPKEFFNNFPTNSSFPSAIPPINTQNVNSHNFSVNHPMSALNTFNRQQPNLPVNESIISQKTPLPFPSEYDKSISTSTNLKSSPVSPKFERFSDIHTQSCRFPNNINDKMKLKYSQQLERRRQPTIYSNEITKRFHHFASPERQNSNATTSCYDGNLNISDLSSTFKRYNKPKSSLWWHRRYPIDQKSTELIIDQSILSKSNKTKNENKLNSFMTQANANPKQKLFKGILSSFSGHHETNKSDSSWNNSSMEIDLSLRKKKKKIKSSDGYQSTFSDCDTDIIGKTKRHSSKPSYDNSSMNSLQNSYRKSGFLSDSNDNTFVRQPKRPINRKQNEKKIRNTNFSYLELPKEVNQLQMLCSKVGILNWTIDNICDWITIDILLDYYVADIRRWLESKMNKSNKNHQQTSNRIIIQPIIHLLRATPDQMEHEMKISNYLHQRKLIISIYTLVVLPLKRRNGDNIEPLGIPESALNLDTQTISRWLDDIGLSQYKELFEQAKVDGVMLHYLNKNDLMNMKILNEMHIVSIRRAIQLLRVSNYNLNCLKRRSCRQEKEMLKLQSKCTMVFCPTKENISRQVIHWTCHRVMEWLRTVDLAEYSSNLRGSGVHGALMILEPRFTGETFAKILNIPHSKSLIRRHLTQNFHSLIGKEALLRKQHVDCLNPITKIKIHKRNTLFSKRSISANQYVDEIIDGEMDLETAKQIIHNQHIIGNGEYCAKIE
ncbi:hypothetical protein SNEBB_009302 [Seison nebaliae]|nr:hypothetical protein SNEBB_009302 [Seison nebaliae]